MAAANGRNEFNFIKDFMMDKKEFDAMYVMMKLKETEYLLKYLKNISDETDIPKEIKVKLSNVSEKFDALLLSWESSNDCRKHDKNKQIREDLWAGNFLLKHLFEDNIEYNEVSSLPQFYCNICKINFVYGCKNLLMHLKNKSHLDNYRKAKLNSLTDNETIWSNSILKLLFEKYVVFKQLSNKLFCKICCSNFAYSKLTLLEHLQSEEHLNNFLDVIKFDEINSNLKPSASVKDIFWKTITLEEQICDQTELSSQLSNNISNSIKNINSNENVSLQRDLLDEKYDNKNGLVSNIKIVLQNMLMNPDKILNEKRLHCGFFCNLCNYWSNNEDYWRNHVTNNELHKYNCIIKKVDVYICECKVVIVSDDKFYNEHKSSVEHARLARFILNKFSKISSDKEKSCVENPTNFSADVETSDVKNMEEPSGNDQEDSEEENVSILDEDSFSETSSVCSYASRSSICSSRSYRPLCKPKGKVLFGSRSDLANKTVGKRPVRFGLRDLPNGTEKSDIANVFQLFGTVKFVDLLQNNSANVYLLLRDETPQYTVLGKDVMIKNKKIRIGIEIPLNVEIPKFVTDFFSSSRNFVKITEDLCHRAKFVSVMTGAGGIDRRGCNGGQNQPALTSIKDDIKKSYERIQSVVVIGSRATGLAYGDSLLDLFIEMEDNYFGNKIQDAIILISRAAAIESALSKTSKFNNVKVIGDQSPVIQASHQKSGIECRLFFHNGLVVEKTELIKLYLQLDDKIRRLILVVKEWARQTNLSQVVSQYAVTWMVLYYLMVGKTPVIHPVSVLRNLNKVGRTFIAGWDCRFCRDASQLPKLTCRKPFHELLAGFFAFYRSSTILRYIHCPLTGKQYVKKNFSSLLLPPPFNKYKTKVKENKDDKFFITAGLCLQDPLELNINLTENLVGRELTKFKYMCSKSFDKLRSAFSK